MTSKRIIDYFLESSRGDVFSTERSLNQPKATHVMSNQMALFPFVCYFCFVRVLSFKGHTKITLFGLWLLSVLLLLLLLLFFIQELA